MRKIEKPTPPPPDAIVITAAHVAYLLSLSVETVRDWANGGRIPRLPMRARLLRFDRKQIEDWVCRGCPRVK